MPVCCLHSKSKYRKKEVYAKLSFVQIRSVQRLPQGQPVYLYFKGPNFSLLYLITGRLRVRGKFIVHYFIIVRNLQKVRYPFYFRIKIDKKFYLYHVEGDIPCLFFPDRMTCNISFIFKKSDEKWLFMHPPFELKYPVTAKEKKVYATFQGIKIGQSENAASLNQTLLNLLDSLIDIKM